MPTARELLEQADALMRRNRARPDEGEVDPSREVAAASAELAGRGSAAGLTGSEVSQHPEPVRPVQVAAVSDRPPIPELPAIPEIPTLPDIPELTDVVAEPAFVERAAPAPIDIAMNAGIAQRTDAAAIIAEIDAASEPAGIVVEGEPSVWLDEATLGEASVTGPAPDSVLVVEPAEVETAVDAFADGPMGSAASRTGSLVGESSPPPAADLASLTLVFDEIVTSANDATMPRAIEPSPASAMDETRAPPEPATASTPSAATDAVPASRPDDDLARWEALAEEIRMQVLQRIDIFTDTGLKAQLDERLKPVVDRASAELVGTVSQQVGQLLRAYVAEAIEREIDKWRRDGG